MSLRAQCFGSLVVSALLAAGCSSGFSHVIPARAVAILDDAESFELLCLDPERTERGEQTASTYHGWKVLGVAAVPDADTRQRLLTALKRGVDENKGAVAACFNPRHGIRATRGSDTAELVICFECFSAEVYLGGRRTGNFLTTNSPQPVFDDVLRAADVLLAKKPGT
jgi:hypothetical protein